MLSKHLTQLQHFERYLRIFEAFPVRLTTQKRTVRWHSRWYIKLLGISDNHSGGAQRKRRCPYQSLWDSHPTTINYPLSQNGSVHPTSQQVIPSPVWKFQWTPLRSSGRHTLEPGLWGAVHMLDTFSTSSAISWQRSWWWQRDGIGWWSEAINQSVNMSININVWLWKQII